MRANDEEEQ